MITDKMIAEAAAELNEAMLRSLPEPSECVHQFSRSFERKMRRITRRANHPVMYRVMRSAACFILVVILAFASLLAISPTVRAAVVGWVKEQYETFTSYFFQGDELNTCGAIYELSKVPDGYTLSNRVEIPGSTMYIYVNEANQLLQFNYISEPNTGALTVVHDNHVHSSVILGNICADLYISTDSTQANGLVWQYDNALFILSGFLSPDELIMLAQDIMQIN